MSSASAWLHVHHFLIHILTLKKDLFNPSVPCVTFYVLYYTCVALIALQADLFVVLALILQKVHPWEKWETGLCPEWRAIPRGCVGSIDFWKRQSI